MQKVKKQMGLKGEMILKTFSILQVLAFEKISFVCFVWFDCLRPIRFFQLNRDESFCVEPVLS